MWLLYLFILPLNSDIGPVWNGMECVAVSDSMFYSDDGVEKVACSRSGQLLQGPSGTITTPGYSESKMYPPRAMCKWTFQLPPLKYISFEFDYLDVELSNDCKPDALEFVSLNPLSLLKKYCGSDIPRRIILPTNNGISVRFRSDDLYAGKGAKIRYKFLSEYPECEKGQIRCRNDECVSKEKTCNKIDDCGDGTDEEECSHAVEVPKTCGRPKHSPVIGNGDRIIGGQETVPHSWPWQVSIQSSLSHPSGHFCGGTLINNLWVVTAGHCMFRRNLDTLRIHLGMHNRFSKDNGEIIRYPSKTCIHPDFKTQLLKDDIALVKLNAPVSYTDTISPVCLPPLTEHLEEGIYCHVTGWGSTYGTGSFHVLKQTMVPIIDHDKCKKMVRLLPLSENTICSGFTDGQYSPCFGDSGGPFVCDYNYAWHLSGVVSWGPTTCGIKEEPSVYTKVADYKPWLDRIIENDEKGIPNRCM